MPGRVRYGKFGRSAARRRSKVQLRQRRWRSRKIRLGVDMTVTTLSYDLVTVSSAGAVIQSYFNIRNPQSALDWGSFTSLYDYYMVHAFKIKWIPTRPFDTTVITNYQPMLIVTDHDDVNNTSFTSTSVYLQYPTCVVKNLMYPWTYYTKVPGLTSMTQYNAGTAGAGNVLRRGQYDINTRPDNGIVSFYATGVNPASQYGVMVAKYYVTFTNRR